MTWLEARKLARKHFPNWSRHMRARWVMAKMRIGPIRVEIGGQSGYNPSHYYFARTAR